MQKANLSEVGPRSEIRRFPSGRHSISWLHTLPFLGVHLMVLGVIWVGWSPVALGVALAAFWLRMFAITGFYHRYLSHRTYKTSRWFQFVFALLGNAATQKGPLWWASHHRIHHLYSDEENDVHSPVQQGFLYDDVGLISPCLIDRVESLLFPDRPKFSELRFLDRF